MEIYRVGGLDMMIFLDFLEILITMYTIYILHVFSLCLQNGKIAEYEPLHKFYWLAFLTVILIIQKFFIHVISETVITTMKYTDEKYSEYSDKIDRDQEEEHLLSMQINSLLRSVELLIFLIGMTKHF